MNVYDFDKTIFDGDSTMKFYFHCMKKHPSILTLAPSLLGAFLSYKVFKKKNKTQFKEVMYRFLTKVKDVDKEIEIFWDKNISGIKKFYSSTRKDDDLIISASPEFLIFPICEKIGIKYMMASKVDKFTGKYDGVNCHGKEKVRRFYEVYEDGIIDVFYSDSYADQPLAQIAKKSYMVFGEELKPWVFK